MQIEAWWACKGRFMMVNALLVSDIFVTYIYAQENTSLYVTLHFYNSLLLRLFEYRVLSKWNNTYLLFLFLFIYNSAIIFTVD